MASRLNDPVMQDENYKDFSRSTEEILNKNIKNNDLNQPSNLEAQTTDEDDYHVRAGRIGGETTKQRHRDSNFYKQIGALGGTTTMARHGQDYSERRKKGGL